MLSMARCYPCRDVIHGEMLISLSMARCYPWRDVIITIRCRYVTHDKILLLSMAICYYLLIYSAIMAMFSVVDDDVHVAINGQLSEI